MTSPLEYRQTVKYPLKMPLGLLNFSTALVLSLALIAPKMTAVLTSLLPGYSIVVLCTGNAIERILIDSNGQPVTVETTDHAPCVTQDPVQISTPVILDWVTLTRTYARAFIVISNPSPTQPAILTRPLPQGPPILLI